MTTSLLTQGLAVQAATLRAGIERDFQRTMAKGRTAIIEAALVIGGQSFPLDLHVYATYQRGCPGQSGGNGERPVSPPEPAGYVLDEIRISNGHYYASIESALSEEICAAIMEQLSWREE